MATHIMISRILIIIFAFGIMILDFWYYRNRRNHPTRWVKLAYSMSGLSWLLYGISIFIFPDNQYPIMATTASPLIAFTLGSLLGGSILRFGELYSEIKLFEKLKALHDEQTISNIHKEDGDNDI